MLPMLPQMPLDAPALRLPPMAPAATGGDPASAPSGGFAELLDASLAGAGAAVPVALHPAASELPAPPELPALPAPAKAQTESAPAAETQAENPAPRPVLALVRQDGTPLPPRLPGGSNLPHPVQAAAQAAPQPPVQPAGQAAAASPLAEDDAAPADLADPGAPADPAAPAPAPAPDQTAALPAVIAAPAPDIIALAVPQMQAAPDRPRSAPPPAPAPALVSAAPLSLSDPVASIASPALPLAPVPLAPRRGAGSADLAEPAALPAPATSSLPALAAPSSAAAPVPVVASSPAMVAEAGAAQGASPALVSGGDIEARLDQLDAYREAARSTRPELTVRHSEFGAVHLRLDAAVGAAGEWRALLTSRDPGFVPAVQAALAERAVAATSESAGQQGAQTGSGRSGEGPSAHGQGFGQSPYGSSPGSGQGSSLPYSAQITGVRRSGDGLAGQNSGEARPEPAPGGGLFA